MSGRSIRRSLWGFSGLDRQEQGAPFRLATALDEWAQQRDRVAPERGPKETAVLRVLTEFDDIVHTVLLTDDDVDELRRRLLGT